MTWHGQTLEKGTDYTVEYGNNVEVSRTTQLGYAEVVVSGVGNFKNTTTLTFAIEPIDLSDAVISGVASEYTYTGSAIEPEVTVTLGGVELNKDVDYTVEYGSNVNAGNNATIAVTGVGAYDGTAHASFIINPAPISSAVQHESVTVDYVPGTYPVPQGLGLAFGGKALAEGTDFTVAYGDVNGAGGQMSRTATITGSGNFAGTAAMTVNINPYAVQDGDVLVDPIDEQTYTGSPITPDATVRVQGVEVPAEYYTCDYAGNVDPGTATVNVTFQGLYSGTASATFQIVAGGQPDGYAQVGADDETGVTVEAPEGDAGKFDGLELVVELQGDGEAEAAIAAISGAAGDGFSPVEAVAFEIHFVDASGEEAAAPELEGGEMRVTLPVPEGWDAARVRVYHMVDGAAPEDMNAVPAPDGAAVTFLTSHFSEYAMALGAARVDISGATVSSIADQAYTGSTLTPSVTVTLGGATLIEGTDYTVSYAGNVGPGTATVTVTGIGGYEGTATATFRIVRAEPPAPAGVAMQRLYNPNSGEHFYTASVAERDHLVAVGWSYEGVGWTAPKTSSTPVFRLYNPYAGEHHYTTSAGERDMLVSVGWSDEGVGWYSDDARTTPLYRQYNPNAYACNHNYTTSKSENDWLVGLGWQAEGIGWYGL